MSEFWEPKIKVCKLDIKVLFQKCWVGPPTRAPHKSAYILYALNPITNNRGEFSTHITLDVYKA